jgi:hypothetical protein
MANSIKLKEWCLFNIKDFIKIVFYGCGISGSDYILKFKGLKSINGNVLISLTHICFLQWLFRIKSKEKIQKEEML